jgi:hypothetical protein
MSAILFRPLAAWPHARTPADAHASWPNSRKLTLARALDLLDNELRRMGCHVPAYIEADVVSERDIRLDGQLRSDARFVTPGVVVYARHPRLGELRWACDGYVSLDQNVRAIAGTIEALRAVDRYRCVRDHEQFRGFKALPASTAPTLSTVQAAETIAQYSGVPTRNLADATELRAAVRRARALTHPDHHQGDRTGWDRVEQAARVLGVMA